MTPLILRRALCAGALAASAMTSHAAVIVLDFEGIGNFVPVANHYIAIGIQFSPATLALVDGDAGGSGNFANEPSPNTVMFFTNGSNAVLNYAAGFTTGFSFFYSSAFAASVRVYDGVGATGNLLGSLDLAAQAFNNCTGDPTGGFCNWTPVGVTFTGTARSIDFGAVANQAAFDDITFGSATAGGGTVPEPGTWMLAVAALLGAATVRARRA